MFLNKKKKTNDAQMKRMEYVQGSFRLFSLRQPFAYLVQQNTKTVINQPTKFPKAAINNWIALHVSTTIEDTETKNCKKYLLNFQQLSNTLFKQTGSIIGFIKVCKNTVNVNIAKKADSKYYNVPTNFYSQSNYWCISNVIELQPSCYVKVRGQVGCNFIMHRGVCNKLTNLLLQSKPKPNNNTNKHNNTHNNNITIDDNHKADTSSNSNHGSPDWLADVKLTGLDLNMTKEPVSSRLKVHDLNTQLFGSKYETYANRPHQTIFEDSIKQLKVASDNFKKQFCMDKHNNNKKEEEKTMMEDIQEHGTEEKEKDQEFAVVGLDDLQISGLPLIDIDSFVKETWK
eukprot:469495_1